MEEKLNSDKYILFEGENDVRISNFCYEYTEKAMKKRFSNSHTYKNLNSHNRISKWPCKDNVVFNYEKWEITPKCSRRYSQLSDLGMIGKHNLEKCLNKEDQKRRHKTPMLWLHDHTATYSTPER
ncbi:hypothetical protein PGO_092840 [Plasmodium gonderi]|uniref:Uncharacterized protein n=1 Tax=Plasmodium gonderi TaxID=77519 RepID=A0A1Y1JLY9_PLAGO|nr:hypothetical protein PGO_092840 [Plasmodium gonderi]GAW81084.1 hypothetical protein PGO_092840 [Plasmodium gonderi]